MKLCAVTPYATGLSLASQLDRLSLESDTIGNLLSAFKSVLPNFSTAIGNANGLLKTYIGTNVEITDVLNMKHRKAVTTVTQLDWLNYGNRLITIPENFKGTLLEYTEVLTDITKDLYQLNTTTLAEYNAILASFITNKSDKIALKDHTSFFKRIQIEREKQTKRLGAFTKAGAKNKVKLSSVLARANDLEPLLKAVAKLSNMHSRDVITNLHEAVRQSTDRLDIIINQMQTDSVTTISPAAAMNISKGAYEVAKMVEFTGAVFYDVTVLLTIVDAIVDSILVE